MDTNLYDQPAYAKFTNTYVPINFDLLYRIGAALKELVDQAYRELSGNLQKWSEFQSPSEIDTQNYYNLTTSKFKPIVEEMSSNLDLLKTPEGRYKIWSMINSLDYNSLSKLKQSSENLSTRQKMIALMAAQGKYNPQWDTINISKYNTLDPNQGIMTELSPIEYMTANQLSEPYFKDLRPGTLKPQYIGGVKYQVTGNTYEDLQQVAKARFNDLINTPQGQKYYEQFLESNGGDQQLALEQFTDMIALSQLSKTIRPKLEVDNYWAQMNVLETKLAQKNKENAIKYSQMDMNRYTRILQKSALLDTAAKAGVTDEEYQRIKTNQATDSDIEKVATNTLKNVRSAFSAGLESKNRAQFNTAVGNVIATLSSPLSPYGTETLAQEGSSEKIGNNTYKTATVSNMLLADDFAVRKLGYEDIKDVNDYYNVFGASSYITKKRVEAIDKLRLLWQQDKIRDAYYLGVSAQVTDLGSNYSLRKVYVPYDLLKNFTALDKALIGKTVSGGELKKKFEQDQKTKYTATGNKGKGYKIANAIDDTLIKTISTIDDRKYYVEIEALYPLASEGEQATTRDAAYNKHIGLSSKLRDTEIAISQAENEVGYE